MMGGYLPQHDGAYIAYEITASSFRDARLPGSRHETLDGRQTTTASPTTSSSTLANWAPRWRCSATTRSPGGHCRAPDRLVISPGPCSPLPRPASRWPPSSTLPASCPSWACLGHQALARPSAGKIIVRAGADARQDQRHHWTSKACSPALPRQFTVNRYHSLAIERASCPEVLAVTAWTEDGEIMGVRHPAAHRGRAVPPREHPDRAWPCHAEELPGAARLIDAQQLLLFIAAGWLLNLTPGPDVLVASSRVR